MKYINLTILFIVIYSCQDKSKYINPSFIQLTKGDSTPIYISTNSCCNYCVPSSSAENKLQNTSSIVLVDPLEQCTGCSTIYLYYYTALNYGKDSITIRTISPRFSCETDTAEIYDKEIIHVNIK